MNIESTSKRSLKIFLGTLIRIIPSYFQRNSDMEIESQCTLFQGTLLYMHTCILKGYVMSSCFQIEPYYLQLKLYHVLLSVSK